MKELAKKIGHAFEEHKLYYLLVLLFFCVGIVLGVYAVKSMNITDRQDLTSYYTSFINSIGKKPIDYGILLLEVLKKNIILIVPIIIFSFTFFGAPIILGIDLIKGFTIGYTFTFLLTTFDGEGLWIALSSIIPQNIIYIPCIIALSIMALSLSTTKFKEKFIRKTPIKNLMFYKGGINILIILLCIIVIGIVVETYICPNIIKLVVTKLYL
ncbi:stage II sporulation protein M [Clostridium sp.]|uniref:stage II sporulation protein M n=1 Tax=Clostridium sp. TaxID=1506 RepID=UPI002FC75934